MDMRECPGHFGHIELARPCTAHRLPVHHRQGAALRLLPLLHPPGVSKEHKNYALRHAHEATPRSACRRCCAICQGMRRCNGGFDLDEEAIVGEDALLKGDSHRHGRAPAAQLERLRQRAAAVPRGGRLQGDDHLPRGQRRHRGRAGPQEGAERGPHPRDTQAGQRRRTAARSASTPCYARPDWFVVTVLAVPPSSPCVPPSCLQAPAVRSSSDDLTYKLADIVKINLQLRRHEQQGAAEPILQDYTDLLQYHICTLMDNEMSGQPQSLQRSREAHQEHSTAPGGEGRPCARQPHGEARGLQRALRHHTRPQPGHRPTRSTAHHRHEHAPSRR